MMNKIFSILVLFFVNNGIFPSTPYDKRVKIPENQIITDLKVQTSIILWVDNFFHRHIAGINFDESKSGFRHIIFKPNFIEGIDFAKGCYNSIYGEIKAEWEKQHPI